jgi:hypothetical protein
MIAPASTLVSAAAEPRAEYNYRFLANGALKSSILIGATKTLTAIWLNQQHGGTVSVARWHGVVPYLVFHLDPLHFTEVTTYSTIAAALMSTFLLLSRSVRVSRNIRRSAAALPAVIGTIWLVAVDLTLHFLRHGYIQPKPMLTAVALLFLQLAVAVVFITRHGEAVQAEALIQHEVERAEEITESPATSPIAHLATSSWSSIPAPSQAATSNTSPTTHQPTGAHP